MEESQISCLILAAGLSRRFKSPKMLHPIADAQPLILATLACYKKVFEHLTVVIGDKDAKLAKLISQQRVNTVTTADNYLGISQSIIAGVTATANAAGWLIGLGDMPYVQSNTIRQVKAAMQSHDIVMPRYRDRQGNPVGFDSSFKRQLLALSGDTGAKSIIERSPEHIYFLDTSDQGILIDIDYPQSIL